MKSKNSAIWCKAASRRQTNKQAALISCAIRHSQCLLHGRGSTYCSSLITLQNRPHANSLTHKCGCDPFCQGQKTMADFHPTSINNLQIFFSIYIVTLLTGNRFWWHLMWHPQFWSVFALCFLICGSRLRKVLAVPAVLTLWHIKS